MLMDFETAIEELNFHCGSHPDIEDPRWAAGFLQTLRPYRGQLDSAAMITSFSALTRLPIT